MSWEEYGFARRLHKVEKVSSGARQIFAGSIVLTTPDLIQNEVHVQRDLEIIIQRGLIDLFGMHWRLAGCTFTWPTAAMPSEWGEDVRCVITVNYRSEILLFTEEEAAERLASLMNGAAVNG